MFADLIPGTHGARVEAAGAEILHRTKDDLTGRNPWFVVTSPAEMASAPAGAGLWLRGYECDGLAGSYTALVLIRAARATGRPWIVSGLGPRGMAASLAIGAAGVVVDVPLWTIDESPLSSEHRRALAACTSGRDTQIVDGIRVLTRTAHGGHRAPLRAPQSVGSLPLGSAPDQVLEQLRSTIEDHLSAIRTHNPLGRDPLGTGFPIVQGPMANITEQVELARAVAAAGALPFAALGALRPDDAAAVLRDYARLERPWGVGVIGFDVMPHRDAHLEAIRRQAANGPAAVILAGATPQLATQLTEEGLPIWLHTPSGRLSRRALLSGIEAVVLEGHEAGGHVGQLTSASLWEEGLAAAEECGRGLVVLAGGIGDRTSAAFAAAMAAPAVRAGAEVVLQAGTAFLFTHEILESGQITPAYQQAALNCEDTLLVGATVNLPLRCAPNAFVVEARALEQQRLVDGIPRPDRRRQLERHNLGRTRIAAKGLQRNPDFPAKGPRYTAVPRLVQVAEGAFSLGQGATVSDQLQTVAQLVRSLTTDALDPTPTLAPWGRVSLVTGAPSSHSDPSPTRPSGAHTAGPSTPIAIVGLGCVLPRAVDIQTFWDNLIRGVDAIAPIPEDRWHTERYFDSDAGTQGPVKSYAHIAGTIDGFDFDPLSFRIPPRVLRTLDPSQRLALAASRQAVNDAEWMRRVDHRRAAVILGNSMGGEYAKSLALRVRFREVLAAMDQDPALSHLDAEARAALHDRVEERLAAGLPPVDVDTMPGLLSNVVAGRVASWLDWMGGNMTVDAACAASLAAVAVAVDWLRSGRCDAVLTGGVDTDLAPETFVGFCRTGALSRTGSHPFSARADGFVMGEGCAVLAMKRLDDALRDGDPIWAVIRGIGQSSDGRGKSITAPRAAGQRLAIERAYAEADFGPEEVGMVEAHGTGTALGDATEVGVLTQQFHRRARTTWLGSVKSMIGHLKGGAGAAGLTKAALAVATGTIPPTLHAGPLNPTLGLQRGPFRLPRRPVAFPDAIPRASVSAFGFGGTNFHVLLEAPPPEARRPESLERLRQFATARVQPAAVAAWRTHDRTPLVLAYGADSASALIAQLEGDTPTTPSEVAASPHRVVLVSDPDRRARDVARATAWLRSSPKDLSLAQRAFRGVGPPVPAVVVVPGQGAQRPGAWDSVATLPAGAAALAELDAAHEIAEEGRAPTPDPLPLHRSLFAVAVAWSAVLREAQVPIAASVGHSLGELGALVVARRLAPLAGLILAEARGRALQDCPPGAMVAVEGDAEAIAAGHGLVVAAENTSEWSVLAGSVDAVASVAGTRLRVTRAFHSPAVAPAAAALQEPLRRTVFTDGDPCYSVCTAAPFTDPATELSHAITSPVRFSTAVRELADHRLFVELGPGRFLSRCIEATLPHARCVPLDPRPGEEESIPTAAAALLAAGHAGLLENLPGSTAQSGLGRARPGKPSQVTDEEVTTPVVAPTDVRDAVIAAICEISGYPPDFLDESADLEGDLGIDSIRKMEILGLLEERLGFTTRESDYVALAEARIETFVAHVEARLHSVDDAPEVVGSALFYAEIEVPISPPKIGGGKPNRYDCPAPSESVRNDVHQQIADWMTRAPALSGPVVVVRGPDPASASSVGFARSLGCELDASVRTITVYPGVPNEIVDAEVAALDRPDEVILRPEGASAVVQAAIEPSAGHPTQSPVILATGGVSGIVAACLKALSDLDPQVVILGRREADVSQLGIQAQYHRCDLTDADAVRAAVDSVYARWGDIDIVLHGAGTLRDAPVSELTEEDREAVLGPKIDGTANLFAATRERPPALWVSLSSIVARRGNAGQTLYGAANAVLEAWSHPTATRSLAIPYTAWAGVGMASRPALQALFRSRGIRPLQIAEGTRAFRRLIFAADLPSVISVSAQPLSEAHSLPWPLGALRSVRRDHLCVHIPLDPSDLDLDHHRVGGRPLVPAAMWVCALQQAAALIDTGPGPRSLETVIVHAPTFVDHARSDVYASIERIGDAWHGKILAGDTVVAEATLSRASLVSTGPPPTPLSAPRAASPLYTPQLLFHGPHWQVLTQIENSGNGQSFADVFAPQGLHGAAAVVDAAHQLLSLWSGRETGRLGLPVGARRWVVADQITGPLRLASQATASNGIVMADVQAIDATGAVVITGEGVRLKPAARCPRAYRG